ncbi:unnamed protein product, partial [Tetraodon nigroviridis]
RSTKGASKARRDHINYEIRNLRSLLPISQEEQERLSYLHSMAAVCTYIRKTVLFQGLVSGGRSRSSLPYQDFLQALHGFILVTTAPGKLVYVSENVSEYLGLSMIDVLQGDSFYDMVESSDAEVVKANMDLRSSGPGQLPDVRRPASVPGSLHPHGGPAAGRPPPLVPRLLQRPQAGHELHSGVRQARTPDAPLVPDCLSVSDMCDITLDCALHQDDFGPLEQPQGGGEVQAHHVPQRVFPALSGLLTPSQSPSSAESDRYDEREQVEISILAQQISSLASSFTKHHPLQHAAPRPSWPNRGPLGHSDSDLILDEGVFDLILDDLDLVTGKSSYAYQQSVPDEHLAALDAFGLQIGHQDRGFGFHPPGLYTQSGLQPGKYPDRFPPFSPCQNPTSHLFPLCVCVCVCVCVLCLLTEGFAEESLY